MDQVCTLHCDQKVFDTSLFTVSINDAVRKYIMHGPCPASSRDSSILSVYENKWFIGNTPTPSPTQTHRLVTEIHCHKRIYYGM